MALGLIHVVEAITEQEQAIKPLILCNSRLKQLYLSNKMKHWVIKVSVAYLDVHILRYLQGEMAWATDKQLWAIINIILLKIVILLDMYVCMCMYVCVSVCVCLCVCVSVCVGVCVCLYVCMYACMYVSVFTFHNYVSKISMNPH